MTGTEPTPRGASPTATRRPIKVAAATKASYVDIAYGKGNAVHVLYRDLPASGLNQIFYVGSKDGGITWAPPINLTEREPTARAGDLRLVVDGAGLTFAIWKSDATPPYGDDTGYGNIPADLVYRVLTDGTWSATRPITAGEHVLSFYAVPDPAGKVHVVWAEEVETLGPGYYSGFRAAGLVRKAVLEATAPGAPTDVLMPMPADRPRGALPDGYIGLDGYVDDSGRPHFMALKYDSKASDHLGYIRFDGERETTAFKATQFSTNNASYNTLPRLLRDARGRDHALAADFLVEPPGVYDHPLDPGSSPAPVRRVASKTGTLTLIGAVRGPTGKLGAIALIDDQGDGADDVVTIAHGDAGWAPAVNLTNNRTLTEQGSGNNNTGIVTKSKALYAAGAFDPSGAIGVVIVGRVSTGAFTYNTGNSGGYGGTTADDGVYFLKP